MKKVYILEQLGCANCGAKIERDVNALDVVEEAILVFPTKQLRVTAASDDGLRDMIEQIARGYESDITVRDRDAAVPMEEDDCCDHDHEHEHHHHHDDDCDCCDHGHEHEHHHHHDDDCDCCDHDHKHHEHTSAGTVKKVYLMEELCCANCGAKIERAVNGLPAVEQATLVFPTKQLRVTATDTNGLREDIERIARSIESDIHVTDRDEVEPVKKVYLMEELCCANCGAKIEHEVSELSSVVDATLSFPTKQLRVTTTDPDGLREQIEEIARGYESDIHVVDRDSHSESAHMHSHEHHYEHHHEHDGCCEHERHEHTHEAVPAPEKSNWFASHRELTEIICGAVLFVAGLLLQHLGGLFVPSLLCYIVAYIILGRKVVLEAVRHLFTGLVFDESFLMTVATLGAFAIQEFPEAVGVMLFFQIGEYFEDVAVEKSRSQIMEAVDLRPEIVTREINGTTRVIPAVNARVGDILVVRPGDRVPLDGIVLSGESFLDTSAITGEPVPVRVTAGDELTSGCVNTDGVLRMRVERPLSESMVTRILDSVENAAASKPKIDRFITRFARVYTPFVVALAAIVAIIPSLVTGNWHHWVYTALTFLVISCPCALVLSVPLAFFSGIGTGSRKGILFKGGLSLEALADVKAAVMDKTGTLTHGTFTVTAIEPADGISEQELLALTACCEQTSTHPIAVSILTSARERGCSLRQPDDVHEAAGHGISAKLENSVILCGNTALMKDKGIALPSLAPTPGATAVLVARDGNYLGRLLLSDTIKDGAAQTVAALKSHGITSAILTGDSAENAAAVAQQTGIPEVHAQLLPQQKLEQLAALRQKYGPVLFVGDGINDAPVLAGADVGAAMGSGADAAIEAADVVFLTSELDAIPESIAIARAACGIAKQNVVFALAVKAFVMLLGLFGIASMWLAVFADTGVAMLCVFNSIRILYQK